MDFNLSDDQQQIVAAIERLCAPFDADYWLTKDTDGGFPHDFHQALAKAGWLLTLVDLTDMRRAQLQRDQAMNFISHDIRAPNASILTLLEMQRAYPGRMPDDELMLRIERYARASLGMAENFVKLASAESQEYRMAPLDLVAVLAETVDDIWALARDRGVEVTIATAPETGQ